MAETIYAPNEDYSGSVVGVDFTDGKGSTDDDTALAYFRRHGYGVGRKPEPDEPEPPSEPTEPVTSLATLRDAADPNTPEEPVKPEGGTEEQPQGDNEPHPEVGEPVAVEQPNRSASKANWVDFAVSTGVSRDEAEAMTRDQLADEHG